MSVSCITAMPGGANKDCLVNPSKVRNILFTLPDFEYQSLQEVMNQAIWKGIVNADNAIMTGYIPGGIDGYEPTTDDPNIITSDNTTIKTVTTFPVPSATANLRSNACDFNELTRILKNTKVRVIYIHEDGSVKLEVTEDGKYRGLEAKVTAINRGIHEPTDVNTNFRIWINHEDYDAFTVAGLFKPLFNVNTTLTKSMPTGMNMSVVTPYVVGTGIVRVSIVQRCTTTAVTGAEAAPYVFSVVDSSYLNTPAVTLIAPVAGQPDQYDLTLNKEVVPVAMASGESMKLGLRSVTTGVVAEISSELVVTAP